LDWAAVGGGGQGYDVSRLIAEADEDGNGAISLEEFCNHMRKRSVLKNKNSEAARAND